MNIQMSTKTTMLRSFAKLAGATLALAATTFAADTPKPQPGVADEGHFSISVNGKRVATESFRIEQRSGVNVITSDLKFEAGSAAVSQKSEMDLGSSGELKKYSWQEVQPSQARIVVEPQDANFLVEHITSDGAAAVKDVQHPLSPTTSILDDNFFSHVEVLAWKYLGLNCRSSQGPLQCDLKPQKFPVLIPHQQQSMIVEMSFEGMQTFKTRNGDQTVGIFKVKSEDGELTFWLNDQQKLTRLFIPDTNTEVARD